MGGAADPEGWLSLSQQCPQAPSSVPRLPAQAFRMILPAFLQSRYLSRRTECTRGLQKLEGADLLLLLLEDHTGPACFFGLAICFWYSIQPLTSSCRIIT